MPLCEADNIKLLSGDYWEEIPMYLQAKGWADFEKKIRATYWTALKMNWKVWTPFQFVNVNFVPVQVCVSLTSSRWAEDGWQPVLRILPSLCFCFSVPSTFCQHGGLVLVCLPCICEEVKPARMSSGITTVEENGFSTVSWLSALLLLDWLYNSPAREPHLIVS